MHREIDRIRLSNLGRLIAEAGSADALARRTGTSGPYISQIRSGLPYKSGRARRVGDRLAAKLEKAMDKPHGWMDRPPPAGPDAAPAPWSTGSGCPVITWSQAGAWIEAPGFALADAHMQCPIRAGADTFVLRIGGESMAPRFHAGDFIFVDPDASPRSGSLVVVRGPHADAATFKQLIEEDGRRYLKALNPRLAGAHRPGQRRRRGLRRRRVLGQFALAPAATCAAAA